MEKNKIILFITITLIVSSLGCITFEKSSEDTYSQTLHKRPERIVSLAPSNTEILFALGLEDKIVGVTEYCNYPEEAKKKEKVGGFSTVNLEKVISLKPDLIIASPLTGRENIESLRRLGFDVVVIQYNTLEDVLVKIRMIGNLTGKSGEASILLKNMEKRINAITEKVGNLPENERPRVLYLLWHDPLRTAGKNTFEDDLIRAAGGINIAGNATRYPIINLETIIKEDPQVIIVALGMSNKTYEYVKNEDRLKNTAAIRNRRLYVVDSDIVNRPGPRIVEALEEFAKCIHPEYIKK